MRLIVALLLIALLPLRGWSADAMAIQMSVPTVRHAVANAEYLTISPLTHTPCHETASSTPKAQASASTPGEPGDESCGSCASCQACFTLALTAPITALHTTLPPWPNPSMAASMFTSADLVPGQRPPIS